MAIRSKLTTRDEVEAERSAAAPSKPVRERSAEEKALRKERVAKAKDALARSATTKGEQVPAARAALKLYLQRLNEPRQPTDEQFEVLLEAPFRVPKKKTNDRRF